jgi:hypothetical protein
MRLKKEDEKAEKQKQKSVNQEVQVEVNPDENEQHEPASIEEAKMHELKLDAIDKLKTINEKGKEFVNVPQGEDLDPQKD